MTKIKDLILSNILLSILLILFFSLIFIKPTEIKNLVFFIDYKTILTLTGLLTIATAFEESGYLRLFSEKLLNHIHTERQLFLLIIFLALPLSAFLTNDIALFILIPVINTISKYIENDLSKLIIFTAISVNVGSSLTPIGNPQNIFLWHKWDIPFSMFILKMLPLFLIMFFTLLIFIFLFTKNHKLNIKVSIKNEKKEKNLFYISLILFVLFLISLELKFYLYTIPVIFIIYLIFYTKVLFKIDWLILVIFSLMFIDFHLLTEIEIIKIISNDLISQIGVFNFSILLSQIISNVPATIFLSKFSNDWYSISYGVNLAGNGFIISSLANFIALRLSNTKNLFFEFHKYSFLFLAITYVLTCIWLFVIKG